MNFKVIFMTITAFIMFCATFTNAAVETKCAKGKYLLFSNFNPFETIDY